MLDQTEEGLNRLPADLREIAEKMAHAIMASELREDFLPADQSGQIARDHQAENTPDWVRAKGAAVASLLALRDLGYALHRQ